MKCLNPYTYWNQQCIPNDKVTIEAYNLIEGFETILKNKKA